MTKKSGKEKKIKKRATISKILAPEYIHNEPEAFRIEDLFHRALTFDELPKEMSYDQLYNVIHGDTYPIFSLHVDPLEKRTALNKIKGEIREKATEQGTSKETRAEKLEIEKNNLSRLKQDIQRDQLRLFRFNATFDNFGETYEEMETKDEALRDQFANFSIKNLVFKMKEAIKSVLPFTQNRTEDLYAHTDNVVAFYPFLSTHTIEEDSIYYGRNKFTGAPFAANIWKKTSSQASYDRVVFGKKGFGKSFAVKLMLIRERIRNPDLPIMILDPVETKGGGGEYGDVVKKLGGEVIELGIGSGNVINPLDPRMSRDRNGEIDISGAVDDALALFISRYESEITSMERDIFGQELMGLYRERVVYEDGERTLKEEPTISDLVEKLEEKAESEEEQAERKRAIQRLTTKLETYTKGQYKALDQKTNVDLEKDIVSFDVSQVRDIHRGFFMTLALRYIERETVKDYNPKIIVCDESQVLMNHEQTAEFLERYTRVIRRYNASPILISQSVDDYTQDKHGNVILQNMQMHFLFHHDHISEEMQKFYNFNGQEKEELTSPEVGKSLILSGDERSLVYIDATDEEYEMITTKPEDKKG